MPRANLCCGRPLYDYGYLDEALSRTNTRSSQKRALEVGLPTAIAVQGNKIIPGLMDEYLGRTNYEAQQTDRPEDRNRDNNLWTPIAGDHAAHGAFEERAYDFSSQLWANINRRWLALAGASVAAVVVGALWRKQD